jgi:hypothetical protein
MFRTINKLVLSLAALVTFGGAFSGVAEAHEREGSVRRQRIEREWQRERPRFEHRERERVFGERWAFRDRRC